MREFELDGDHILMIGAMPDVCDWIDQQGIEHGRVPLKTVIRLDETTDEWVWELWSKPLRIDPATDQICTVKVRRRVVSLPDQTWVMRS